MSEFFNTNPVEIAGDKTPLNIPTGEQLCVISRIGDPMFSKSNRESVAVYFNHVSIEGGPDYDMPILYLAYDGAGNMDPGWMGRGKFQNLCAAIGIRLGDQVSKDEFIDCPLKISIVKRLSGGKTYHNIDKMYPCNKMELDIVVQWKRSRAQR